MSFQEEVKDKNAESESKRAKKGTAKTAAEAGEPLEQSTERINPEIDKRLDEFIANNPERATYYNGLTKERLVRSKMLDEMRTEERIMVQYKEELDWIKKNPDIEAQIKDEVKDVPEGRRLWATIRAAKNIAANMVIKAKQSHKQGVGVGV